MCAHPNDGISSRRKFKQRYGKRSQAGERTATQNAELIDRRAAIRRRLLNIREIQTIYMTCVPSKLAQHLRTNPAASEYPEDQVLFFPSSLSTEDLRGCIQGLALLEERLRDAQLYDSLDRLRVHLHIRSRLAVDKTRNVRHQGANTRARRKIDVNESKIIALAEKYRVARQAKHSLVGPGDWESKWRPLDRSDVRTLMIRDDFVNLTAEEGIRQISEGRRTTSWIWMSADSQGSDTSVQAGMQDGEYIILLYKVMYQNWCHYSAADRVP